MFQGFPVFRACVKNFLSDKKCFENLGVTIKNLGASPRGMNWRILLKLRGKPRGIKPSGGIKLLPYPNMPII